jgi:hypothetical protein
MRQGDGAELLGPDDPRSETIGIIHVAPHDDRVGVLYAISTQAGLGRKQVVLDLPEVDNRAFQTPTDFDGLKDVRRDLKIDLVVIAPSRSGPAELARLRRFPVYSSLESFARSLQDQPQRQSQAQDAPAKKGKGWAFWRRQAPATPASPTSLPPQPPASAAMREPLQPFPAVPITASADTPDDDEPEMANAEEDVPTGPLDNVAPVAAGAAGMGMVAGYEMENLRSRQAGQGTEGMQAPGAGNGGNSEPVPPSPIDDEDTWTPPPPPPPKVVDSTLSSNAPGQEEAEPGAKPAYPNGTAIGASAAPGIIQLSRKGDSGKLPVPPVSSPVPPVDLNEDEDENVAASPVPPPPPSPPAPSPVRQRNTGKTPAAVAGAPMVSRASTTGGLPPTGRTMRGRGSGSPPSRGRRRWLLLVAVLLLLLLLTCGGIAIAAPGMLRSITSALPGAPPTATVTITPDSKDLKIIYQLTAVTGTPDVKQRQVQARQLSASSQSQSKTVPATGTFPAQQATGIITFYNGRSIDQKVNAGTTFNVANGVQIITDKDVDIPAANLPNVGVATVSAHAVPAGEVGNIAPLTVNVPDCCGGGGTISAKNLTAFHGGQNAYTVVSQSDIDGAANALETSLTQSAQTALQKQVHSGEQLVAPAQCTDKVTSDHNAGDRAGNVTVTVTATCTGETYDQKAALALAADLLKKDASTDPGPGYQLVGALVTTVTSAKVVDTQKGIIALHVEAEGIWVYQFTDAQKQMLANLIKGKSKKDALAALAMQPGVAKVSIDISSGDVLPTDASQITINIVPVSGLQVTPTTASGSPAPAGSPTVTRGTPTVIVTQPGK